MTKSGIAELRRLLRTRSDAVIKTRWFESPIWGGVSEALYVRCLKHKGPGQTYWSLTPAELRMFLTFVLYAETDK